MCERKVLLCIYIFILQYIFKDVTQKQKYTCKWLKKLLLKYFICSLFNVN